MCYHIEGHRKVHLSLCLTKHNAIKAYGEVDVYT
jgi:hypothetical protein